MSREVDDIVTGLTRILARCDNIIEELEAELAKQQVLIDDLKKAEQRQRELVATRDATIYQLRKG